MRRFRLSRTLIAMSSSTTLDHPISPHNGPTTVSPDFALPLRATDFDAGIAGLLHRAVAGETRRNLLGDLCEQLARLLRVRLVLLAQRLDSGSMNVEATSSENSLWLELQRIPEHWDSGLSSHGPAGEALRQQAAIHMHLDDEGFALWRAGAGAEHVREILALPVTADDGPCVLELYFNGEIARGASNGTLSVAQLSHRIETFLADLRAIEQQQLVARALSGAGNAAFITDLEGTIVWSNGAFSALSGYAADEVRGRNPSLLRSGEQGVRYYRKLWGAIRAGEIWSGETVDRGKDGQTYTIHQTVSPVSHDGRITHYVSIHQDIGPQKKARVQLERASRLHPETGLLTAAAFEDEVHKVLAEGKPAVLVLVSLRGLQRADPALGEDLNSLAIVAMGKRVHETVPPPDLAGCAATFEYMLLLRGDVSESSIRGRISTLSAKLAEPLPYIGEIPDLDVHFGMAVFPTAGATFKDLRLKADRLLANEPYRRAQRDTH